MKRWFGRWKQPRRWDNTYYRDYGYMDSEPFWGRRSLWKQTVMAMTVFGVFISFHDGEHWLAKMMDNGVRYVLNQQMDITAILERTGLAKYVPGNLDLSVYKILPVIGKVQPKELLVVPVDGKVAGNFGWRVNASTQEQQFSEGMEWDAPAGAPVKAVANGQVKAVSDSAKFGKTIVLQHNGDMETVYGYCTDVLVQNGDPVTQGQNIAKAGKKKDAETGHIYLEVRVHGQAIDPRTKMHIAGP